MQTNSITHFKDATISRSAETGNTDPDHSAEVSFVRPLSAGDIPEFLQHRRRQIRAKTCSVAQSVSRLADRVKISEALISEMLQAHETLRVTEAIEREKARLEIWRFALDMARADLKSLARRLAA